MHLHRRAVQRYRLDLDTNDLLVLQFLEHAVQHAALTPAVHARIHRVPIAETLWQPPPLAALLGDVEDGIENFEIGESDIASLGRQAVSNFFVLGASDFHGQILPRSRPIVLTRPS